MERKDRGILLIAVLFIILFFANILEVNGANAYINGGTQPGKAFEIASNWTGGTLPGDYTDDNHDGKYDFDVANSTSLYISGNVKLEGNLNLLQWGNLYIEDDAIFIINGNFELGDCSDVYIGENATLYIMGDLNTHNVANNYWYTKFVQEDNSNVVIEKNLYSYSGQHPDGRNASVVIYQKNSNCDFYVFGSKTGDIWKTQDGNTATKNGTDIIENEQTFSIEETTLPEIITTISESIDEISQCNTLNVNPGETLVLTLDNGPHTYCYINIGCPYIDYSHGNKKYKAGKIIIEEGVTLNLTQDNTITCGSIINYGTINCKNKDFNITPRYSDEYQTVKCQFENNGSLIVKNANFGSYVNNNSSTLADSRYLSLGCGSNIFASNDISFMMNGSTGKLNLLGDYVAKTITIDYENGGSTANFGSECGTSNITAEKLILKIDNGVININELTNVTEVYLKTTIKFNVDGSLTLGKITSANGWQSLGINAGEDSRISLCWNPTEGADFGGNGQTVTSSGTVIYRIKKGPDETNYWDYENSNTPVSEGDIAGSPTLIANNVSFEECMEGVARFLPIELTSFIFNDDKFIWETASETNNDYFVVEYSSNGTTWCECTSHIPSLSNTGWIYECTIPESTKCSQFSYYRLKQVDFDGKYSYSDILSTSWKVQTPQRKSSKAYITSDGKILYNYDQLPTGTYIEKSENGIRKIVKIK